MKLTKKLETEILKSYNAYWNSYLKGDMKTFAKLLDDNCHIIGSTEFDVFRNKKSAVKFYTATADQIIGKADFRNRKITVIPSGENVMVEEFCDFYFLAEDEWRFYGHCRLSTLFSKKENGWKIIYQHGSMPDSKAQEGEQIAAKEVAEENKKLRNAIKRRTVELENKNRELEIETSLERVRARTMSMQHSEELADTASILFQQIKGLGFETWSCGFCIWKQNEIAEVWMGADSGGLLPPMMIPYKKEPTHYDIYKASLTGAESHEKIWEGKALEKHYDFLRTLPSVAAAIKQLEDAGLSLPTKQCYYVGFFKQGYLLLITKEPNAEIQDISKRFSKVFEQAYTRFLDLQKAEAQAREAEIELALERVRARTMAMQHSDELLDAATLLFQQIELLRASSWNCSFNIWDEDKKHATAWNGIKDGFGRPFKSNSSENVFLDFYKGGQKGEKLFVKEIGGTALKNHYKYLSAVPGVSETLAELKAAGVALPTFQIFHIAYFAQGYLMFITYESVPEFHEIFKRFANVFEQTYTRFLDLQKAEAQAREAEIELALERVRSRSMAMYSTHELSEVIFLLYKELIKLDFSLDRSIIVIIDSDRKEMVYWMAGHEGMLSENGFSIPYFPHPFNDAFYEHFYQKDILWTYLLDGKEKKMWDNFAFNKTDLKKLPDFIKSGMQNFEEIYFTVSSDSFGGLLVASSSILNQVQADVVTRFTKVFNQSYTRFLDLQKAEAQAREAQIQLALERVRARTMAMQKSEELSETVYILFQQFKELGENPDQATIGVINEDEKVIEYWVTMHGNQINKVFKFPIDEPNVTNKIYNAWKENKKSLMIDLSGSALTEFMTYRAGKGGAAINPEERRRIINVAFFSKGLLNVQSNEERSEESIKLLERFASVFEQTYTRFLDLQKAEAQAREAEIELALERIRARTMAMQHSDELADASLLLDQQIRGLGIKTRGCAFNIYGEKESTEWFSNEMGTMQTYKTPREKVFLRYYEAGQKGETLLIKEFSGKECVDWYNYLCTLPVIGDGLKEMIANGGSFPTRQIDHVSFFKYGYLLFLTFEPVPEFHEIFKRFAKVFEQTYTRFLDLQKAEAQAREAQIEAALEKVRSRSMGMQKSEELKEVIKVVYEQFVHLNINVEHTGFIMDYKERDDMHIWLADQHEVPSELFIPYFNSAHWNSFKEAKEKENNFFANYLNYEEKNKFYKSLFKLFPVPDEAKEYYFNCPALAISTVLLENVSLYIENFQGIPYTDEENKILMRFGKVFQQTYTRFLDLEKAEAQAREAQIEAALEKVRSIAMSMMKSDELLSICEAVFKQLQVLGFADVRAAQIYIRNDAEEKFLNYDYSDTSGADVVEVNYNSHPHTRRIYDVIKNAGDALIDNVVTTDQLEAWKSYLYDTLKQPPEKSLDTATELHYYLYSIGTGAFGICTFRTMNADELQILKRFRNVFNLSYQRYYDMTLAEAQAREAKIETALERVRSRTLAMQKSDELAETSAVLFKQLIGLGIAPNRLYIGVINDESGNIEFWITDEDGSKVSTMFSGNANNNGSMKKMHDGWKQQKKSIIIDMHGKELADYFHYLGEELRVPFKDGLSQKRRLQYISYFSKGFIGMASPDEQPPETVNLLNRFASVFNLTFTRFNDLTVAEVHALQAEQDLIEIKSARQKAEDALKELQATQKQLIQSEKMASLGELTAGIAHEIQNPLNFVNNFSEVNKEMLEELKAERLKPIAERDEQTEDEIINDVIDNSEKINHHGKRAGDIVKGMLQHSRTSTGVKELTDINALADEYLRLSYHGLRAKDKSFNAAMKTDFDENIGKINIIPPDIGRVLLNLYNNAFYAVNEQKSKNLISYAKEVTPFQKVSPLYEPTVSVTTQKSESHIIITVSDNGNGIPKKIVDKIFQPFFTTKPTGQGTGLGLSLSYDIIKAHGGEIKVESKEGEGTEFIIQLPNV